MNIRMAAIVRTLVRLCVGLLAIQLGALTLILFCTTSQPAARAFIPNLEPDFGLDPKKLNGPDVLQNHASQRSSDLQYVIGFDGFLSGQLNSSDLSRTSAVTVYNNFTSQKLGIFHSSYLNARHFALSPDRRRLLTLYNNTLHVRKLQGREDAADEFTDRIDFQGPDIGRPLKVEFSPDGGRALFYDDSVFRSVSYDLRNHKQKSFDWPADLQIHWSTPDVFFDPHGRAKVLMNFGEIWDLASHKLEFELESPDLSGAHISNYRCRIEDHPVLASFSLEERSLLWRSLIDGRILRKHQIPPAVAGLFQFSPDGKWLIGTKKTPIPFIKVLREWNTQLASRLEDWLPEQERSILLELETGRTWCDYLGEGRCDFTDDGSQMRSFIDEGYYVYDLPPRTRWFTLWTWAPLGAWFGTIVLLWKLRKAKSSPGESDSRTKAATQTFESRKA